MCKHIDTLEKQIFMFLGGQTAQSWVLTIIVSTDHHIRIDPWTEDIVWCFLLEGFSSKECPSAESNSTFLSPLSSSLEEWSLPDPEQGLRR